MTTTGEQIVSRVLRDRAATITSAPDYAAILTEPDVIDLGSPARRRLPTRALLIAAAVILLLAAAPVAWRLAMKDRTAPATVRQCSPTGTSAFAAAARAGRLPADSTVLAFGADDSVLAKVDKDSATTRLVLVSPVGRVTTIWAAGPNVPAGGYRVLANPSGAVGQYLVTFVLQPNGGGVGRVVVVDRPHNTTTVLPLDPGYRPTTAADLAPVAGDDDVEFVETATTDATVQRVVDFFVVPSTTGPTVLTRTTGLQAVLPAGGNDILIGGQADGTLGLVSDGDPLPTTLAPAVRGGRGFASDGTTLRWLADRSGRTYLMRWRPGDPQPRSVVVPADVEAIAALGGGVVAGTRAGRTVVVDLDSGATTALPVGWSAQYAGAERIVLADGRADPPRWFALPRSTLAAC